METLKERVTLTDLLTRDDLLENLTTKEALLAHGVRLFHRYGVHGTSVGKILEASSKSKSQFYFHFADKDDFVCKVLDLEMSTMLRVARRHRVERVEDIDEWFEPYVELGRLPGNLGCPVGPAASELSPSKDSIRKESAKQFQRWQQHIIDMLTILGARERFPYEYDPDKTGRSLSYSIQGAFLMGRVFQAADSIVEVRDNFRQQLMLWREKAMAAKS